jgi:hypothetical protein
LTRCPSAVRSGHVHLVSPLLLIDDGVLLCCVWCADEIQLRVYDISTPDFKVRVPMDCL